MVPGTNVMLRSQEHRNPGLGFSKIYGNILVRTEINTEISLRLLEVTKSIDKHERVEKKDLIKFFKL